MHEPMVKGTVPEAEATLKDMLGITDNLTIRINRYMVAGDDYRIHEEVGRGIVDALRRSPVTYEDGDPFSKVVYVRVVLD